MESLKLWQSVSTLIPTPSAWQKWLEAKSRSRLEINLGDTAAFYHVDANRGIRIIFEDGGSFALSGWVHDLGDTESGIVPTLTLVFNGKKDIRQEVGNIVQYWITRPTQETEQLLQQYTSSI
ncbi:Uncharacterised protein [Neisseria zoodegmatis]|uniref:Uncharacterized protein n=1 Tax=Neisseria zoodegmatis TaxID=326523 RepID=A0A378WIX5_9NEIS|nr:MULTISPECIES: hypothetical protein [Neisseria]SUA36494.1 Uncharacterised protein [Neisseria zoodegmatis]